jgi:hypothetical protein
MNIQEIVERCSVAERGELMLALVRQHLRDRNGNGFQKNIPITNDTGTVVGLFVPAVTDADEESDEFYAELMRRENEPGDCIPLSSVIAELEGAMKSA